MNLSYNTIYTFIMASLGKAQSKKEKKERNSQVETLSGK